EQRLNELGSRPSLLNPLFYGLSFGLGAVAGRISDRISLGFVAATEQLVERHLDDHLTRLPKDDLKSRAILEQMRDDEIEHANHALQAGGEVFLSTMKEVTKLQATKMTSAT